MYKLRFSRRARKEIAVIWNWYEDQSYGLGGMFEKAVQDCAEIITNAPLDHAVKFKSFREVRLKKFPFLFIYTVNEKTQTITVTSIFHVKRNPKTKY